MTEISLDMLVALGRLSEREREVIVDRLVTGMTLRAVAEDMALSPERVRQLERRALARLADMREVQALAPNPKPAKRIVNRNFRPLDPSPLDTGVCPVCDGPMLRFSRAHVVPKGLRGDDVPENAAWICGDGVMGCHGLLTHRNRVIGHRITADEASANFVRYCRETVPFLGLYADRKKGRGWLETYYLGGQLEAEDAA